MNEVINGTDTEYSAHELFNKTRCKPDEAWNYMHNISNGNNR